MPTRNAHAFLIVCLFLKKKALHKIQDLRDIVIKLADKGGAVVIMNKFD